MSNRDMNEIKIGVNVEPNQLGMRDAGHIACVVCRSDDNVRAGMYVRFVYGLDSDRPTVVECERSQAHGIVDPFAPGGGRAFLVLVHPRHVSGLTHHYDLDIDAEEYDDYDPCCDRDSYYDDAGDGYYGCAC